MGRPKHLFASKTFWLNVAAVAVPIVTPYASSFVAARPAVGIGLLAAVNIINRVVGTSQPVDVIPR